MFATFVIFGAYVLVATARWLTRKFGAITLDQIIFHVNMPLDSSEKLVISYFSNVWFAAVAVALVFYFFVIHRYKKELSIQIFLRRHLKLVVGGVFFASLIYVGVRINVHQMWSQYQRFNTVSTYFEDNYVDPRNTKVSFPAQKRNLIVIFMESMDTGNLQTEYHDYFNTDLTPELKELVYQNLNFSDNDDIGGAFQVRGTNFTQAGITAQTCGLPLKLPVESSHFRPENGFLPEAKCLYEFLAENGYEQTLANGMPGTFGGLDKFLESHGKVKLMDTNYLQDNEMLQPQDYSEGTKIVKDSTLLNLSKQEIIRLAKTGKPFAFTVMTIDTHLGRHFFDREYCETRFDKKDENHHYKNIFACQSKMLGEFVAWIQAQPFYKNTTIVMLDDHLLMSGVSFVEKMKNKRILNIFINSAEQAQKPKNRKFLSFDIYPTILNALGAKIEGDRLGLGTSLFGNQQTMAEREKSIEKIDKKLDMRSKRYEEILYNKIIGEN